MRKRHQIKLNAVELAKIRVWEQLPWGPSHSRALRLRDARHAYDPKKITEEVSRLRLFCGQ